MKTTTVRVAISLLPSDKNAKKDFLQKRQL